MREAKFCKQFYCHLIKPDEVVNRVLNTRLLHDLQTLKPIATESSTHDDSMGKFTVTHVINDRVDFIVSVSCESSPLLEVEFRTIGIHGFIGIVAISSLLLTKVSAQPKVDHLTR